MATQKSWHVVAYYLHKIYKSENTLAYHIGKSMRPVTKPKAFLFPLPVPVSGLRRCGIDGDGKT